MSQVRNDKILLVIRIHDVRVRLDEVNILRCRIHPIIPGDTIIAGMTRLPPNPVFHVCLTVRIMRD